MRRANDGVVYEVRFQYHASNKTIVRLANEYGLSTEEVENIILHKGDYSPRKEHGVGRFTLLRNAVTNLQ